MPDDRNARDIEQDKINNEIMRALGRLEGKMENVVKLGDKLTLLIEDHDRRIDNAETGLSNIKLKVGLIGAVIGAAFSAIGDWLWRKITGHQ